MDQEEQEEQEALVPDSHRTSELRECAGTDIALWYGPAGIGRPAESPHELAEREAVAKSLCARCPIRLECLEEELALPVSQQWGVRGGMTERERRAEIRRRRKAASRKAPASPAAA